MTTSSAATGHLIVDRFRLAARPPGTARLDLLLLDRFRLAARLPGATRRSGHLIVLVEVGMDPWERSPQHLGVALGQDPADLVVDLVHDLAQLGEPGAAGIGDHHAEDAPVAGIGTALHQP